MRQKGHSFEAHAFIHAFDVVMFLLLAVGPCAVYLRQRQATGTLGSVGFGLTAAGFVIALVAGLPVIVGGITVSDDATLGILNVLAHPIPQLLYTIGAVVFSIGTFKAAALPRRGGLLPAVGYPMFLVSGILVSALDGPAVWVAMISALVAAGGWAILGQALYAEQADEALAETAALPRGATS